MLGTTGACFSKAMATYNSSSVAFRGVSRSGAFAVPTFHCATAVPVPGRCHPGSAAGSGPPIFAAAQM